MAHYWPYIAARPQCYMLRCMKDSACRYLEAMACGTPVVASEIPVLREIGADAAVYVDPTNPEAIAAGLLRLLEDAGLPGASAGGGPSAGAPI